MPARILPPESPSPKTSVAILPCLPSLPPLLAADIKHGTKGNDVRATTITLLLHEILEQHPVPHGGIND